MDNFTATYCTLETYHDKKELPLKEDILWWQARGLMYTATGFGSKIPTEYKVKFNGRWLRVYCRIFSNSGTLYIISKGKEYIIDIDRKGMNL